MGSFADRHGKHDAGVTRREALALAAFGLAATPGPAFAAGLEGQLTWGIHVSLAPTWFDPAETPGIITPLWSSTRCTMAWSNRCRVNRWHRALPNRGRAPKTGLRTISWCAKTQSFTEEWRCGRGRKKSNRENKAENCHPLYRPPLDFHH